MYREFAVDSGDPRKRDSIVILLYPRIQGVPEPNRTDVKVPV